MSNDNIRVFTEDDFKAQRNVAFFLRIHGHLPDDVCGKDPISPCEYREDGRPINWRNDYVEKLRKNPEYRKAEQEVLEAQKNGVAIRIKLESQ